MDKKREEQYWEEYLRTGSPKAREALIEEYAPLVKYVAGRVITGFPANVEFDDLVSYGIFGLIDAIDKFDPARGIKFETYAISRIKGAILDGLRSNDWAPVRYGKRPNNWRKSVRSWRPVGRYATDRNKPMLQIPSKNSTGC